MKRKLLMCALLFSAAGSHAQVTFTSTTYNQIPVVFGNFYSNPMAVADMNGDYLDDIISVDGSDLTILYQQAGGGFTTTTITTSQPDNTPDWSLAVGDIDKNGFNDIIYGGGGSATFMKANATGTAFTETSFVEYIFCQRTNFVDINNDGNLDAYSCHDVGPNVYFLNDGSGNLTYYSGGIGDHPEGGNYGSIWIDYDNDGDQDCFIAKCRGGGSDAKVDELHRNNGDGTFTDVSDAANMNSAGQAWSSAWNDYDNDGDLDALVGASSDAGGGDASPHEFMRNNGDGTFTDITTGSGWDLNTDLSIEYASFDFDNDGFADVMAGANKIMYNNGDMTFTAGPAVAGLAGAIGDLNNDGFLDFRAGNKVFYNDGNNNNWIKINLKGIASNYNGIGARVEIYGAWGRQIRNVQSGSGFAHMHTLNPHFGIGSATAIDSIVVKWPSGTVDVIENPAINTPVTIVEGAQPASLLSVDGQTISVFPNPASDQLFISNYQLLDITAAEIYNMRGEKVLVKTASFGQIDLSGLADGAYVLLLQTADGNRYSEPFLRKTGN